MIIDPICLFSAIVGGVLGSVLTDPIVRWWRRRRRRKFLTEFPRRDDYGPFEDYLAAVRQYMAARGLPDHPEWHFKEDQR